MKTTRIIMAVLFAASAFSRAATPVSGRPVPEMTIFDTRITNYMDANSITSGVVGIMRQGQIVYLKGFGQLDPGGNNVPENVMFRLASLSKPVTAAAIRMMAADGTFGPQGLDRKAFNLNGNGGFLTVTPWPSLGDPDLVNVTIRHLLDQTSGFGNPDCVFRDGSRQVSTDLAVGGPPTRMHRIRWMLGKTQQFTIGTFNYSNFNYVVLGEIMHQFGGGYIEFIHSRVLTADSWTPASETAQAATLFAGRLPREPRYSNGGTGQSVFDYSAPIDILSTSYGGEFDMDGLLGAGSLVASAPAMLQFASRFRLWYPNAGVPYTGNGDGAIHDGGLAGVSTRVTARGDGVVVFMAFNKDNAVGGGYDQIAPLLDAGPSASTFTWPSTTSDGHWITMPAGNASAGYGGFNAPWQGFGASLGKADNGSRLRLKAGTSTWTGRITKRMKLDAPLGTARIGVP